MMSEFQKVKIIVTVPESHAGAVREAAGKAGAGRIGKYSFCSFSIKGVGRSKPEQGADPYIGTVGKMEEINEERIEFTCDKSCMKEVIEAIKKAHPYEELALDIYPLI